MQVSLGLKTVVNPLLGQERPRAQPEVAAGGGRFQPMKWPDSGAVRDQRWRLDDVRPRLADGEPVLSLAAGHCRRAPRGKCRVLYRLLLSPLSSLLTSMTLLDPGSWPGVYRWEQGNFTASTENIYFHDSITVHYLSCRNTLHTTPTVAELSVLSASSFCPPTQVVGRSFRW